MYPINLYMKGVSVLVIGGGHVALRKVQRLLEEDAQVTVMAPDICAELEKMAEEEDISLERKYYTSGDLKGYDFVITATGVQKVAEDIRDEAEKERILFNSADFPHVGNCFLPARICKEGFMITVSTDGKSPAMAKYMKERLAETIPDGYGAWLERVTVLRKELKTYIKSGTERERFWRIALGKEMMELVKQGQIEKAEGCIRRDFSSIRT